MGKIAAVFPGQALMRSGFGLSLMDAHPLINKTVEQISEAVGRDLVRLCSEGDEKQLNHAASVHSLLFALSVGTWLALRAEGFATDRNSVLVGGFSLGEYSAFCASGGIDLESCVGLVEERSQLLSTRSDGAMAVVMAEAERVKEVCRKIAGVDISALVTPERTNISGVREAVEGAIEAFKKLNIGARFIPVDVISHHPSLFGVAKLFKAKLMEVPLSEIEIPLVSATVASVVRKFPGVFRQHLTDQLTKPVNWVGSVKKMREEGADTFVEIGAVSHLVSSIRTILPEARVFKVTDAETLRQVITALVAHRASS